MRIGGRERWIKHKSKIFPYLKTNHTSKNAIGELIEARFTIFWIWFRSNNGRWSLLFCSIDRCVTFNSRAGRKHNIVSFIHSVTHWIMHCWFSRQLLNTNFTSGTRNSDKYKHEFCLQALHDTSHIPVVNDFNGIMAI